MSTTEPRHRAVVIAGGGPTGMMLAAELALAGVDAVVIERRTDQHVDGSRAGGLHSRSLEVLDQRGVVERFVSAGETHPAVGYAGMQLDITDFPTRHNHLLALWQSKIEPILADWVYDELGSPVIRGCEVMGFHQDPDGVDVELSDGRTLRAEYLVGCDGGRSVVRKCAGIDFVGTDPSTSWMIAEVEMAGEPVFGIRYAPGGIQGLGPAGDGRSVRAVLIEPDVGGESEPTVDDLRELIVAEYGDDFGLRRANWIGRFTDMTRQAARYRDRRVLLAGDAAHVHPPQGGQGLNIGIQDAVNLGWKLAAIVSGTSPDTLLDTYHAERHPVGARVLENTLAQVALGRGDEAHLALRTAVADLLAMDEPRRGIAGMISGLDVRYDLGDGHPLLGRRMPDLDLTTAEGPVRLFTLLHRAQPLLLNLGAPGDVDLTPWSGRVQRVEATAPVRWELPVLGVVEAPAAVLVRPDGHVAWTGGELDARLTEAITTWFGPPTAAERRSNRVADLRKRS